MGVSSMEIVMCLEEIVLLAKSLSLNCHCQSNESFFGNYFVVLKRKMKKMTIICDRDEYSIYCRFAGIFTKKMFGKQYKKDNNHEIMRDIKPYIISYFKND